MHKAMRFFTTVQKQKLTKSILFRLLLLDLKSTIPHAYAIKGNMRPALALLETKSIAPLSPSTADCTGSLVGVGQSHSRNLPKRGIRPSPGEKCRLHNINSLQKM